MFVEAVGGTPPNYLPLSHTDNDPHEKKMLHLENVNLGIIGERCTSRWKRGISFQMPPLKTCHRNKFLSYRKKKKKLLQLGSFFVFIIDDGGRVCTVTAAAINWSDRK